MEQGYEDTISQVTSLITAYPPPFIYIHDPATPHLAAGALATGLDKLRASSEVTLRYAAIDAIASFNTRVLYDTTLNSLAEWTPDWDDGCNNWGGPSGSQGQRFNDSLDAFLHGIRAIQSSLSDPRPLVNGKGKAKDHVTLSGEIRLVILIERAERLKESIPELLVPLARLRELVSSLNLHTTVLFTNSESRAQR
jgi:origin recognition complex subunit 5